MAKLVYAAPNAAMRSAAVAALQSMGLVFHRSLPNDQNIEDHPFEFEPGVVALTRKRSISVRSTDRLAETTDAYRDLTVFVNDVARQLGLRLNTRTSSAVAVENGTVLVRDGDTVIVRNAREGTEMARFPYRSLTAICDEEL